MHRPPDGTADDPENPGFSNTLGGNPVPTVIRSVPHLLQRRISLHAQTVQNPENFLSPDAPVPHI